MGFETQEQAERFAEEAEFRADAAKEEKLLASADDKYAPSPRDVNRLMDMVGILQADPKKAWVMLSMAYKLGCAEGWMRMGERAKEIIRNG